jgi:PAS domain S-box-containing protein
MSPRKSNNKGVEILIVEDSPTQAVQLRYLLEEQGYSVKAAVNGNEALDAARRHKPTLIITDVLMPGMDGFTLCREVKSCQELSDVPVVMMTSLSSPQDVMKGLACGADNFIRKPYEERYLLRRIEYILANREFRKGEMTRFGLEIFFRGEKHFITSERQQILDMLISTYEDAVSLNAQLQAEQRKLARSNQILNGLYRMGKGLNQAINEKEVMKTVLERALELPGVQAGWIYLREGETGFRTVAARGLPPALEAAGAFRGDCLCRRKLMAGELDSVTNILECERLQNAEGDTRGLRYHASVPLWVGNKTIGVLNLAGPEQGLFTEEDLETLYNVGNQLAVALERSQLHERLEARVEERTAALKTEIAERKRTQEKLAESEEHIRLLLNSTAEAIYGQDLRGDCTFCNPACVRLLGYSDPSELIGKNMHDVIHHTRPDGTPYPREDCRICIVPQHDQGFHVDNEVLWRADGKSFPAEYWCYPIKRNETVIGAVTTFMDVAERRSLERQLVQAQKMEAIGRLAGGVAHDFNNLLTIITGYSDLLLNEMQSGSQFRGHIEEVKKAADRAAALTRQLLAFGRRQILAPQVLNLNKIVADMDKMLRRLIGEDIDLVTKLEPALSQTKVDPGQVEQVIMNLAVNSRDAMSEGGKLTIETANAELDENYARRHAMAAPGPYVMLAVSDTGCGMDAETQSHIFEPFFTTKEQGKGTGLGLATVYGIVKQIGGEIWVYSEPAHGTTLKVYFPQAEGAEQTVRSPKTVSTSPRGSEAILVVEDEEAVRSLVRRVLESQGYAVMTAATAEEAAHLCEQHPGTINLMLTDVVMPGMSGRKLAQHLGFSRPEMKVLYMSGYTDNAIVHHGVLDVGTQFLQKPFTPDAILRKVREVLDSPHEPIQRDH